MNNVESKNLGSMLRRIIAMALVLSLVVIPVQFPGSAAAVEEALTETYFSDDFTADAEDEVVYRWNEVTTHKVTSEIADGVFKLNVPNSNFNTASATVGYQDRVYLTGMQGGEDITQTWSDYTTEFDMRLDLKTAGYQDYNFAVMAYMDEEGQGYGVRIDPREGIVLVRAYKNENGVIVMGREGYSQVSARAGYIHVKLTVTNTTYTTTDPDTSESVELPTNYVVAEISGFEVDGTFKSHTVAKNMSKYEMFIEGGSVGAYVSSYSQSSYDSGYHTEFVHEFDNLVVTKGEEVLFADDFSDNRYKEGSTAGWNDMTYEFGEFRFKQVNFTDAPTYNTIPYAGGSVRDGMFCFDSNYAQATNQYVAFAEQKNANGQYEIPQWEDFTVTTQVSLSGGSSVNLEAATIYGRVSYDAATGKYSYYRVLITGNSMYVQKVENGTQTYDCGRVQQGNATAVTVSFETLGKSLQITVTRSGANPYVYTDDSPLGKGGVGIGFYSISTNRTGHYQVGFDYLNVTDESGTELLKEDFESANGIIQTGKTPNYKWNRLENDAKAVGVASKWSVSAVNSNVYTVAFDNPAEGSVSSFRMDLDMQVGKTDVRSYLNDYMLQFNTWIGSSNTPSSVSSSYEGVEAVTTLQTGALLRVQPVLDEDGNVVDYTYYRVRQAGTKLLVEKRWYNPATEQYEIVELGNLTIGGYHVAKEDVWHRFQVTVSGNTIKFARPRFRADRTDVYASYTANSGVLSVVDDGTYGAPYLSGGVSLWAQAEHSDTAGENPDWNVFYDQVSLYNWDMNRVFYDDFENSTYLGETAAAGASAFYLFDNYAYTDEKAYTSVQTLKVSVAQDVNWNVADGVLTKTTDVNDLRYVSLAYNDNNDAFDWDNYGVSAKFNLVEGGYAGILFGYDGTDCYELRFNGTKAAIYKITNGMAAAAPVAEADEALTAGEWISVSLKVVDGVLTYQIGTNAPVAMAFNNALPSVGTVGLDASNGVSFDDVAVYTLGGAPAFNVVDGRIYCKTLIVNVTDDDLVSFTVNGAPVNGTSAKLDSVDEYTLVAEDAQGHVTTANIEIRNTDHQYVPTIYGIVRAYEFVHGQFCIYCNNHDGTTHKMDSSDLACATCEFDFMQAEYNGTNYTYIQNAMKAAHTAYLSTGIEQVVKLNYNLVTRGLEIRPGVVLDLNGYYLNCATMVNLGQIIDSVGTGGLRTYDSAAETPMLGSNKWLPLLDEATGYYRFFETNFENLGVKADGEFQKFGMRLTFKDAAAYDLLLANDIEIGFAINWTGLDETLYYVFKDATVEKYVNAVKAKLAASEEVTTAMILKVRELEKINLGYPGEMVVTPILMTDATDIAILESTSVDANPL